jgi:hypothetical protein
MQLLKLSPHALIVAAASNAHAQVDGKATWLWEVTTDDGDSIVEPGESAQVSLMLDMDPDVNYPDGPVLGLGGVAFDLVGDGGAANGQVTDWQVNPVLIALIGDLTTTDGVSLFGVTAVQFTIAVFSPDDPIQVITFSWRPSEIGSYSVQYDSSSWNPISVRPEHDLAAIWTGTMESEFLVPWPVTEAQISFNVVPPPTTALTLALSISVLTRRSRN